MENSQLAGGQHGADLAVGVAGERAVDLSREAGDGHRLLGVVFLTTKVKVTSPPVSGTAVGSAVLVTSIVGATSVKSTVASSVSVASVLSLSSALAVKTLTWSGPE